MRPVDGRRVSITRPSPGRASGRASPRETVFPGEIALEFPYYGWPRITAELERRGWQANHKRVYRNMREDNLLCLRRRKFVVVTTNSNHARPIYPSVARGMPLTELSTHSPTLEDVFVTLTGRSLRDDA